ncbi:hypothetical protein ABW19_dt0208264 [Dactylella cylindrospora]|nr:hypothetical protein ABW19_dt0208264 [Dactylella cylindrospora]
MRTATCRNVCRRCSIEESPATANSYLSEQSQILTTLSKGQDASGMHATFKPLSISSPDGITKQQLEPIGLSQEATSCVIYIRSRIACNFLRLVADTLYMKEICSLKLG